MVRILFAAGLVLFARQAWGQVEYLRHGKGGTPWEEVLHIGDTIDLTGGNLAPLEADPDQNVMPFVRKLGGAAAMWNLAFISTNPVLDYLTDGDNNEYHTVTS